MKTQLSQLKIIAAAVAVLLMAAVGIWYWGTDSHLERGEGSLGESLVATFPVDYKIVKDDKGDYGKVAELSQNDGASVATYRHPTLGFSFQYPKDFKVGLFPDGIGETIVVEGDANVAKVKPSQPSQDEGLTFAGFQIYITPFDESGPLTFERVKKEIPDLVLEGPQTIELRISESSKSPLDGERSDFTVPALVFFSRNESLGKTREVWFVYPESPVPNGNYLYQITAHASFDEELSKIMATWRFN